VLGKELGRVLESIVKTLRDSFKVNLPSVDRKALRSRAGRVFPQICLDLSFPLGITSTGKTGLKGTNLLWENAVLPN